ncbi:MAG: RluA family pseudouridine synthase [Deltaproteobacteria bacterium]|jgi:tRNA pseudouridine32 synthase/23S rRNA pseudouridine746 synthase|nr:RluA family pseudouridine synthase [Deltaproteobacteria bacterium]
MIPAGRLDILHRDDHLVVVNKPGGLLSVPGRGPDKQECVVNHLKALSPASIAQPAVHRLDMATSGLMVLALTAAAHAALSRQFAQRQVTKKYIALLAGIPKGRSGEKIELAFRLDPDNRPHQVYDPLRGKTGVTRWHLISAEQGLSRVEFSPLTGRTHQLRLHAAHELGLHCPIVGDPLYGTGKEGEQLMLHATQLTFFHPATGERLCFTSRPPF